MAVETLSSQLPKLIKKFLHRPVQIQVGNRLFSATYQEIGFKVDEPALKRKIESIEQPGSLKEQLWRLLFEKPSEVSLLLPISLDIPRATSFLLKIKSQVDTSATESRVDLVHDRVMVGESGVCLQVLDSIISLQYEARRLSGGGTEKLIELLTMEIPPFTRGSLPKKEDFAVEFGRWETPYPHGPSDTNRVGNLKLGAEKLDGTILQPGEVLSFNQIVGERTQKAGFRVAPEIGGGEHVDGIGGGMCQLASTLHAAAFFSGLDILETRPHSQPSVYIPPGLDSTVVYPTDAKSKGTDLKLRNSYDFPIMVHFSVGQGLVKVRILGKERPYEAVELYREVLAVLPQTGLPMLREDPKLPLDQEVQEQAGHEGYIIRRYRCFVPRGETEAICPDRDEKRILGPNESCPKTKGQKNCWMATYQTVPEIVRKGTGPITLKPVKPPAAHVSVGISDPLAPFVIRQ